MEALLGLVTWKTAGIVAAGVVALWKGRQVKKAAKELEDLFRVVNDARADQKYTAQEVQVILKEALEAAQAIAPLMMRLVKRFL